jgi:hypothetical protein
MIEYNITVNFIFDNATDRDAWIAKIKTAVTNAKTTLPPYKSIVARPFESTIVESNSENW